MLAGDRVREQGEWKQQTMTNDHTIFEVLVWRGMLLGAVESFKSMPTIFYGSIGNQLLGGTRTGPVKGIDRCRDLVMESVVLILNNRL